MASSSKTQGPVAYEGSGVALIPHKDANPERLARSLRKYGCNLTPRQVRQNGQRPIELSSEPDHMLRRQAAKSFRLMGLIA